MVMHQIGLRSFTVVAFLSVFMGAGKNFNSVRGYSFLHDYGKADAAVPSSSVTASDHSGVVQKDGQKVAVCVLGVCVDVPNIPILNPKPDTQNQPTPTVSPEQPANAEQETPLASDNEKPITDLTGNWVYERIGSQCTVNKCNLATFSLPSLTVNGQTGKVTGEINITQRGNQISIPDRKYVWNGGKYTFRYDGGKISGNKVTLNEAAVDTSVGWGYTNIYTGTVNADGNTVEGEVIYKPSTGNNTTKTTFTWTRKQVADEKGPLIGDIVVYRLNGEITHSGVISEVGSDHKTVTKVTSKWGTGSLYEHDPLDVPKSYGSWTAYHTLREGHNLLNSRGFIYRQYLTDKKTLVPALPDFYAWLTNKYGNQLKKYESMKNYISKIEETSGFSKLWFSELFPTRILAFKLSGLSQKPTQGQIDEMAELEALSKRVKTLKPGPILTYDCHGYTFTNGDVWIGLDTNHGKEVELILKDNGYTIVPALDTKSFPHPDSGINNINPGT